MKYTLETYSLNHIWYREDYEVEANSKEEAIQKVEECNEEAQLLYSEQENVENTRAEFSVESVKEVTNEQQ